MYSIRWRVVNQLRMNSIVMVAIIAALSIYGLVTKDKVQ